MTHPQKNTALAVAIIAAILSLPLTWMTIQNAQFQGGFGEILNTAFGGMAINVTGFNGHVTLLFKTPIWFIVCVAISASVLQLIDNSKAFAAPKFLQWLTSVLALLWVGFAVLIALFSGEATLGVGALLGLVAAIIPVVCLFMSRSATTVPDTSSESRNM